MNIHMTLRDMNPEMVRAWEVEFADVGNVSISEGPIFDVSADSVVSPANSFGYMDGGIDLVFSHFFGWDLEKALKEKISSSHFGELPVGQALVLPTYHTSIPFLVSAPTMRLPGNIERTVNAYLAFRAALIAIQLHNQDQSNPIGSVLVPGLGTGIGAMPPKRAARQMRAAYDSIVENQYQRGRDAGAIWREHAALLS